MFCILQRAKAKSKTGIFLGYVEAEAPTIFKPAGQTVCTFPLSMFVSFAQLEFPSKKRP
jgi:hypothetical protein